MLKANNISLEITDEAKDWIAKLGYDISYGARPLKRVIQRHLINPLSIMLLEGVYVGGDTVRVTLDREGLIAFESQDGRRRSEADVSGEEFE